jgi:hypothetical protein
VWLEKLAPHTPISQYEHNRTGEDNADAHLKRQVMGREVVVAITKGKLDLGPWEQIFFASKDHPLAMPLNLWFPAFAILTLPKFCRLAVFENVAALRISVKFMTRAVRDVAEMAQQRAPVSFLDF